MSIMRISFFIITSIVFHLSFFIYCYPNESGVNRHQSQKLSRLVKRETLGDVYHSLEAFENDEESLPDQIQTPLKRSVESKCAPTEKPKEVTKEPAKNDSKKPGVSLEMKARLGNSSSAALEFEAQANGTLSESPVIVPNRTCPLDVFRDTENFFKNINDNLNSLSKELTKIFNNLTNKTSELVNVTQLTNNDFFDPNKCKAAKNAQTLSENFAEMRNRFALMLPQMSSTGIRDPSKNFDSVSTKISTCIENIRDNVTTFSSKLRQKFDNTNNFLSDSLGRMKNALNPIKNYDFGILNRISGKENKTSNQTSMLQELKKQNVALGVLGQFLSSFTKGIGNFFHVISRKWSHEHKHPHHHGMFGSIKHVFGLPSHVHPEPHLLHKIFGWPHLHSKHHDEHVPLLKKILKIPDHHRHHHLHHLHHHHHPGSIIKHLFNSLYSIFHLSDHCECPHGSKAELCPLSHFFNWLGGKPSSHSHQHHKHVPGHINSHHNVVSHKQPACSCS